MVRHTYDKYTKVSGAVVAALMLLAPAFTIKNNAHATISCVTKDNVKTCECYGDTTTDENCKAEGTFSVSVSELLTVSLTEPDNWAKGNISTFLSNKVSLTVSSNNDAGYEAMMNSETTTDLESGDNAIHTVSTGTPGTDLSNQWGYNLPANNAVATENSTFLGMSTSPIKVLGSSTPGKTTQDIYFGAKGSDKTVSGTYTNTVVVSVVSGVNENTDTPTKPTNPTTPTTDNNNNGGTVATETAGGNTYTVYTNTYTPSGSGETTYSEISSGNNVNAYSGYTAPQGEVNTVASINEGTPLATGLAVTAAVAATAGIVFFIIAKRRSDEDEEEDY